MRVIFLFTHLGAGGSLLCKTLAENPRIATIGHSGLSYQHPLHLNLLLSKVITGKPYPGFYLLDKLIHNYEFSCYELLKDSFNLILIREPAGTINHLVKEHGYSLRSAKSYYLFRLRRLSEISRKCRVLFLEYPDLAKQETYGEIKKYLKIKGEFYAPLWNNSEVKIEGIAELNRKFEKYKKFIAQAFQLPVS